ncbi:MAG: AAA family ATPase [Candidatus Aenigmatarchaeota archaeon]
MVSEEALKLLKEIEELRLGKKVMERVQQEVKTKKLKEKIEELLKQKEEEYKKLNKELEQGQYSEEIAERRKKFIREGIKIMRAEKKIDEAEIAEDELALLSLPPHVKNEIYEKFEKEIADYQKEIEKIESSSEEGFLARNLIYLAKLRDQFKTGIVEVPCIKERAKKIKELIRSGIIPFLYGETGSGKTEMAIKIAREISGKEPVIISGSEKTGQEDLIGYFVLEASEGKSPEELIQELEKKKEEYFALNPQLTNEEKEEYFQLLKETTLKMSSQVVSKFKPSAIFEGLKNGQIIIIDEANRIPPPILSSLHRVFDVIKKRGKLTVPITGEEIDLSKVEGYPGMILTGNVNVASRNTYYTYEIDPALRNRVKLFEYNTPDQETSPEITYKDPDAKRDLYMIGMVSLLSEEGMPILEGPANIADEVWRLSQAFKVFQDAFAGVPIDVVAKGGGTIKVNLYKHNASMRTFLDILQRYKSDGYRYKIDYYIFDTLIDPAKDVPEEAATFYTILKDVYDFFHREDGWKEVRLEKEMKYFPIKLGKKEKYKKETPTPIKVFSHKETIAMIFGEEYETKESKEDKYVRFIEEQSSYFSKLKDRLKRLKF